jgi:signal transduction histidine kinase
MNQEYALLQRDYRVETESVRNQERQRIAQDLHGGFGQKMLLLHMGLAKMCGNLNHKQHDLQGDASLVMRQLGVVMQSLLTVIRGLQPATLDRGFCSAVEWQCEYSSKRFGVPCHLAWSAGDISLTKSLSLMLLRALQETLKNVGQHAQASCVHVIINSDGHTVVMTVIDDGDGIALGNQTDSNFYKLAGLRARIIDMGGKVNLCSARNKGTTLSIELPLHGRWS